MNKVTVKNSKGRPTGPVTKTLQSIQRGEGSKSPSLRGAKNPVLPNIKNGKNTAASKEQDMTSWFGKLLDGTYTDLPPQTPKEVRIFLSSTFTDMKTERNILAKECYPELQDFCRNKYDLDFSVVDMRWGVTDEASNDHSTEELCLQEIQNCKEAGLGPTFVTILGDRYGYRPIPKYIPVEEFENIISETKGKDRDILDKWYKKDLNAVPPHYLLQSIKSHIQDYGSNRTSTDQWNNTFKELTSSLRLAVETAHKNGKVTAERKHLYNMSVTESEINHGIKDQSENHCLCFIRTFNGLDNDEVLNEEGSLAARHTDVLVSNGKKIIDVDAKDYRLRLKEKVMPDLLPKNNLKRYPILTWYANGVTTEKHNEYLKNMAADFMKSIKQLVMTHENMIIKKTVKQKYLSDYDEILHHLCLCHTKCETFVGRVDTLNEVKQYLESSTNTSPLILYAESGGGKTSVMAKIYQQIPTWFGEDSCRMIRFLGTSPQSSNIHNVMWSIVNQLADVTGEIIQPSVCKNMKAIISFMPRFLRNIMRNSKRKYVVLLDSVDQLSPQMGAHNMKWLFKTLPPNFHIIISTIPDLHGIMDNCKTLGFKESDMIQVKPLEVDIGKEVIKSHLNHLKRALQPDQEQMILDVFKEVKNVLFLKLAVDKAMTWHSYTPLDGLQETIGTSVKTSIYKIFSNLEAKFGKILVSHSLGYITASIGGLSVVEIEDILSLDNEVLNDIYQYHPPPVDGVVRIPPLLWARIQNDIKGYIVQQKTHGKNTLFWYHRQFIEAATEVYVKSEISKTLHKNLAKLYMAEDGVKEDIELTRLRKPLSIKAADRQVSKQPLNSTNIRALTCIPYHLRNTQDLENIKQDCLFRLKFILPKVAADGVDSLINEISGALDLFKLDNVTEHDLDLEILYNCLQNIYKEEKNQKVIVTELVARLPTKSWLPWCSALVQQCVKYLEDIGSTYILPVHSCLYNKADNFETTDDFCEINSHYNDFVGVKSNRSGVNAYDLWNFSGKTKTVVVNYSSGPLKCVKDRNVAMLHRNLEVKINNSKENAQLCVLCEVYKINKDIEPEFGFYGTRTNVNSHIYMSLIGKDKSLLELQLTDVEYSAKGRYVTLLIGNKYVFVRALTKDWFKDPTQFLIKIRGDTEDEAKVASLPERTMEVPIDGIEPRVVYACHLEYSQKTLIVSEYKRKTVTMTSVCLVGNLGEKTNLKNFKLPGMAIKDKYQLLMDETYFLIAVYDIERQNIVVIAVNIEEGTMSSFHITINITDGMEELLDVSYSCIGEMRCYILTDKYIHCLDIQNKCVLNTLRTRTVYLSPTVLTVKDDGEYIYIGNAAGRIECIKVENWEYLGYVEVPCKDMVKIALTTGDTSILVFGKDRIIRMAQIDFVNQCRSNLLVKTEEKKSSVILDFFADCKLLTLIYNKKNTKLLTFCEGVYYVWSMSTLKEPTLISYGYKYRNFIPHSIQYNSQLCFDKCLVMNEKEALLIDTEKVNKSVNIVSGIEGTIVACTQGKNCFYVLSKNGEDTAVLNQLLYSSPTEVAQKLNIKDKLDFSHINIDVTHSGKYLVIKSLCPNKEYDILCKTVQKLSKELAQIGGRYKFTAVDLTSKTGSMITCYKNMTKVACLGGDFAISKDHTVLIGVGADVYLWDISTGKTIIQMLKGTKTPMFTNPHVLYPDTNDHVINDITRLTSRWPSKVLEDEQVVAMGTMMDQLNMYRGTGEKLAVMEMKGQKDKGVHIKHIWISPDCAWVAAVSTNRLLRIWLTVANCDLIGQIQLDTDITQGTTDDNSEYLALIGNRSDIGTKVTVVKVKVKISKKWEQNIKCTGRDLFYIKSTINKI